MNKDELIAETADYLRENRVLEGKPIFENRKNDFVCVDPKGYWDEYYMQPPYWQYVPTDFHKDRFDSIDSQLRTTNLSQIQAQALKNIPDSENTLMIEVGSEYGDKGAGYLAAHKPSAKAILLCKKWEEHFPPNFLFIEPNLKFPKLTFTKGKELLDEPDLEKRVNGLYKANGIHNVHFYEHELTPELPNFLQGNDGKDIYLFGHQSPSKLPFLIGMLYRALNAGYMCVSLTAQEKTKPDEFPWKIIKKNLGLSDSEIEGYTESAHDPEAAKIKNSLSSKYNYECQPQKRIAVMIKLGIALALAKEVNGEVLRDDGQDFLWRYNKIDHYVEATRLIQ